MDIPVFVINLKRSSERRDHTAKQLNDLGIPFQIIEAVDGRFWILHSALQGQLDLVLLSPKLCPNPIEHFGEVLKDFGGNMPVRGRDLGLGDHPIRTDQA